LFYDDIMVSENKILLKIINNTEKYKISIENTEYPRHGGDGRGRD